MNRRAFLFSTAAMAAPTQPSPKLPVCVFLKHFQWTDAGEAAALCRELGYDGLDLTVRPGGHILPERVAEDLPRAVETIHKAGLSTPMVTSGIVDARTPHAETVAKTLARLGIRRYRWGGFRWKENQPIPAQLDEARERSRELAAMNKTYGLCAMYHTHSGPGQFGNTFWDLWTALKDLDTSAVSVNLDIAHATVEGGFGAWMPTVQLLLPMTRGIAIKDFYWEKNEKGEWRPRWCPLGKGHVNLAKFLGYVKAAGFEGPVQLHLEYPELGDAHAGKGMTIPRAEFLRLNRADVATLRAALRAAGLA